HALQQGGLDALAAPGALARLERGEDAERAEQAGQQVGDRDADAGRLAALEAGYGHQPGEALDDVVEAGAVGGGAILAVTGDGAIDDPGILRRYRPVADVQRLHHARPEVLDDDIGRLRQAAEELLPLRALDVERERALVAVGREEKGDLAVL